MKFGGSSVADAERIVAVAEIVRGHLERRPVVVVSALGGVTDLLERALASACSGDLDALDPLLSELERRHRWALSGSIENGARRHGLGVEIDRLFEELRQRLRSMRILGEGTPRASDAVLAFGELLSSRIVAEALLDRRLPALWLDPREIMMTNERFGAAEPDVARLEERCASAVVPALAAGQVPVIGGYVGATPSGQTTTLGRGGSDTSAAVLGLALGAEEIQIWTDVDGLMSADPRLVPAARSLPEVSFAEAAELAFYGAKVLHPASIAPAVSGQIPVRVLNSLRPTAPGTRILERARAAGGATSIASRQGVSLLRVRRRQMRAESSFLPRVLEACRRIGVSPDVLVFSDVAIALALAAPAPIESLDPVGELDAELEMLSGRAIVSIVGSQLEGEGALRERVLSALASLRPDLVALGASRTSVTAVIEESRLVESVRALHARFLEAGS